MKRKKGAKEIQQPLTIEKFVAGKYGNVARKNRKRPTVTLNKINSSREIYGCITQGDSQVWGRKVSLIRRRGERQSGDEWCNNDRYNLLNVEGWRGALLRRISFEMPERIRSIFVGKGSHERCFVYRFLPFRSVDILSRVDFKRGPRGRLVLFRYSTILFHFFFPRTCELTTVLFWNSDSWKK